MANQPPGRIEVKIDLDLTSFVAALRQAADDIEAGIAAGKIERLETGEDPSRSTAERQRLEET